MLERVRDYLRTLGDLPPQPLGAPSPPMHEFANPPDRLDYEGHMVVSFFNTHQSRIAMGSRDLGAVIAETLGAEREDGYWPDVVVGRVRLTIEVLDG